MLERENAKELKMQEEMEVLKRTQNPDHINKLNVDSKTVVWFMICD